jgi:hypothetical protein
MTNNVEEVDEEQRRAPQRSYQRLDPVTASFEATAGGRCVAASDAVEGFSPPPIPTIQI